MKNYKDSELVISGLGVTSSIGQGQVEFSENLINAKHCFGIMQRPGRQGRSFEKNDEQSESMSSYIGAEISALNIPDSIPHNLLRTASFSGQVALVTLDEAWNDAQLQDVDSERIGLIIGGSNFQQRELVQTQQAYRDRHQFIRPTYAMSFMDTDLCGLCSEHFGIKGFAYTLGGASASSQVAINQGIQAVLSQQVDVCIVVGALMDLSYWECQSFRSIGAMGSDKFRDEPERAARPFDKDRDGFIYGESCGAIVIENNLSAKKRVNNPYAKIAGWAMAMDANRNPNPSFDGEVNVIERVLEMAELNASDIDYINPHGTGSLVGDETELKAFQYCQLTSAYLNATKSIIGHGLSSAGIVELITTLVQMRVKKLHPSRNLEKPIEPDFNWVTDKAINHDIKNALNMSMGFGGVNTAICVQGF